MNEPRHATAIFRSGVAIACAPIVTAVLWAIRHREWPAGDRSIMGVFTQDVFSRHTPLLGTVSTMGNYSDHPAAKAVHHLGPAQFWALSIPNWLTGGRPVGILLGALLVNCGAIVLVAVFVRRRMGTTVATTAVLMCTVLAYGLGPTILRDVWTPFLGLWPLLALVVLTWSLLDGDRRALPWAALVSGFLAQIELMFVGPAAVLSVAGVAGFTVRRLLDRRARTRATAAPATAVATTTDGTVEVDAEDGERDEVEASEVVEPAADTAAPPDPAGRRPSPASPIGWVVLQSQAIAVAMWWPVAYQELTGHPGNLTLLIRALHEPGEKAGGRFVWHNVVAQLAFPPVWIRRAISPLEIGRPPSMASLVSAVAFALLILALTAVAWRRRRGSPTVFALLLTAYPVLLAGLVNLEITPAAGTIGLQYRRWMWPFGAFLWFVVVVAIVQLAPRFDWLGAVRRRVRPAAVCVVALALAAAMVIPASIGQRTPPNDDLRVNKVVTSMWGPLIERIPPQSTYLGVSGADAAFAVGPEMMRRLVVHGFTMRTSSFGADSYGDFRVLSRSHPADQTLQVVTGVMSLAPSDPPVRLLAVGRWDGKGSTAYLRLVDRLLPRLQGGPGFELTDQAVEQLHVHLSAEGDRGIDYTRTLLATPARAMFDATVLRLQVEGKATNSPLSDREARELLAGVRGAGSLAFLGPAPEIPKG